MNGLIRILVMRMRLYRANGYLWLVFNAPVNRAFGFRAGEPLKIVG